MSVTRTGLRKVEARAWRDGRWWTFEIPELTALAPSGARIVAMGQASTLAELDAAAQDVAALWLDIESTGVDVAVTVALPAGVAELWAASTMREEEGRAAVKEAARLRREVVQALTASGITQRDAARILGVSPGRVSQLANR